MKNLKFFITIILISLLGLSNQVKADTIYVDLDTVINNQVLTFCQNDTLNVFNSQYPNPIDWTKYDSGIIFGESPYIIITKNSMEYSNDGINWTTWNGNANALWKMTGSWSYSVQFYTYFTDPHTEPWVQEDRQVCGTADTLYASSDSYQTGVRYTWFMDGDTVADGYYPSDTSYIATSSGQYVLKTTGCNTISDTINITMIDNTPPDLGGDWEFCGTDPVDVLLDINAFDPDGIYQSWEWSDGTTGEVDEPGGESMYIQSPGTYWIEVNNACLDGVRDSIEVTQVYYPPLQFVGQTNICPGGSTQLCTNFSYDVSMWSQVTDTDTILLPNGSMTDCINISDSMDIMIFVAEGSCPAQTYNTSVTMTTPYQDNQICVATVDTNNYNKIVWDRNFGEAIESYNIYRLFPGGYQNIGNVSIDDQPIFWDSTSNPTTSANRYKIAAVDTCGNESNLSFYHSTIFVVTSGTNLIVTDPYEDESGTYNPSKYYILIDSLNNGNLTIIDSTNTAFSGYTIDNPVPGATYAMGVSLPWACDGAKFGSKNRNIETLSISNKSNIFVNIENVNELKLSIHPNPSSGIFHIDGDYDRVEIFNSIGQQVLLTEKTRTIDLSSFEKGVYFAKFKNAYGQSIVKKIVLQ